MGDLSRRRADGPSAQNGFSRVRILVPPGDARVLAAAILRLLRDKSLRRKLSTAAKLTATHFGTERMASEVASYLNAVAGSSRHG